LEGVEGMGDMNIELERMCVSERQSTIAYTRQ
jgi:hypothetical protein